MISTRATNHGEFVHNNIHQSYCCEVKMVTKNKSFSVLYTGIVL